MGRFSLEQAEALLPQVQQRTATAVQRVESILVEARHLPEGDPERGAADEQARQVVREWAAEMQAWGLEVKGLWLVDFDSGDGYYCWRHPEPTLAWFHGYHDGFSGRRPLEPEVLH